MSAVVVAIGILIIAGGVVGMTRPATLFAVLQRFRTPAGVWSAAALRIAMGLVFLAAAADTRWPLFIQVMGWLTLAAGVMLPIVGVERFGRLIDWWMARPQGFVRAWCVVALALGGAIAFAGT
jgi:hypothetical protein